MLEQIAFFANNPGNVGCCSACLESAAPHTSMTVLCFRFRCWRGLHTPYPATLASSKMLTLKIATSVLWVHTRAVQTLETRAPIAQRADTGKPVRQQAASITVPNAPQASTRTLPQRPHVLLVHWDISGSSQVKPTSIARPHAQRNF
jgi:hypothetical protein